MQFDPDRTKHQVVGSTHRVFTSTTLLIYQELIQCFNASIYYLMECIQKVIIFYLTRFFRDTFYYITLLTEIDSQTNCLYFLLQCFAMAEEKRTLNIVARLTALVEKEKEVVKLTCNVELVLHVLVLHVVIAELNFCGRMHIVVKVTFNEYQ